MTEFWSNNDRGYRIRLWIDQLPHNQDNISNNNSQVRVRLALLNTTTTFAGYSCSAYVDLNGQRLNWSGSPNMTSYNQTIMLIDQTITVGHNADGTKSFGLTASFSGSGDWSPGTLTIPGNSFTLTTIPRFSSVASVSGTIGASVTVNITRQSTSFTHTVRYAWGSKTGTIATGVGTSVAWTIPMDFANDVPNATSGKGTIYVDTYSGSTKIGTSSNTLTASVPENVKPTFTGVTLSDTNTAVQALLASSTTFLQIISNIKVAFNGASGTYGSSITGYKAEIVGKNQTTNTNGGTLGMMNYNGTATVRASVVDSRGRWSDTKNVTITVLEYFSPILTFGITRSGTTLSTFTVNRNAKIAPITVSGSQKNTMTLSFKVAPIGTTNYTTDTGPASGTWTSLSSLTNSQANLAGTYVADKSFTVVGTLSDKFTNAGFSFTVSTEAVIESVYKNGSHAYGKVVDTSLPAGSLEVVGNIYAGGKQIQQWALTQGDASRGFGKQLGATNPDTVIDTGYYWILISQFGDYGQLEVTRFGENEVQQTFTLRNGNRTYRRYKKHDTGVWTPWVAEGIDNFYPIGAIYQSTVSTDPSTFMGGTWERFGNGRMLIGVDESDSALSTANKIGGSTTPLTSHTHGFSGTTSATPIVEGVTSGADVVFQDASSGGGIKSKTHTHVYSGTTTAVGDNTDHNNYQPYITVYMWRRTA